LARGAHYSTERENELHWSEKICLGFVGERLQGNRGGFFKGYWHTSSTWQRPIPSDLRVVMQVDVEANVGGVHQTSTQRLKQRQILSRLVKCFGWRPRGFRAAAKSVPAPEGRTEPHSCFLERVESLVLAQSPWRRAGSGFY
jgi:hypothetical protein